MENEGFSLEQMKLRAFDLTERTSRRGRASAGRRLDRLRSRAFLIGQTAITAGLAWFLASEIFRHQTPFFAPIAAIVCLGGSYGQRLRRGVEIAIGVAVGIGVGDLFVLLFGAGVWQVVLVVALSMSLATLLGAGQLMITQAGVQSIVVTILLPVPSQGFNRWLDAVVGCAIALIVATVAPGSPVRRPGRVAAEVLQELASTMLAAEAALRAGDREAADAVLDRARAGERYLGELDDASKEGLAVVRHSPFRRRQLSEVQAYADLLEPLDRASRNLRVLARRCAVALWRDEVVPRSYLALMTSVAEVTNRMARELYEGHLPTGARDQLVAAGRASSHVHLQESMSAVVILAQTRSILADLLQLTGLDYAHARELIPEMD